MINKSSIFRWAGITATGCILLICCSFLIYNSQTSTDKAAMQACVAKKKKKTTMLWEGLSTRFFSAAEKNPEKTPG